MNFAPAALIRTSTSPCPADGTGTSANVSNSGPPFLMTWTVRIPSYRSPDLGATLSRNDVKLYESTKRKCNHSDRCSCWIGLVEIPAVHLIHG